MQFSEFNNAFSAARRRIRREGSDAIAPAEEQLQAMAPELESEEDRRVAASLIQKLPQYALPPRPRSALMHEALLVERAAYEAAGSVEERIAAMAEARRRIFEIAERAPADEAPGIQALTRVIEHLEDDLRDPVWPLAVPPDSDSR
ncbi:hypothetical protein E1263_29730 [Kribbella antibiotica]|uniref:Uncharacterized protein n=1 Tax=Kribbella antibiotica TaxID=190195 RepID=A0A4V2YMV0_9ACTN|nr:hypothetical protein [Kribbella antibiotica]TDD51877.1 hypothetical protein E1263_29730 [Kribbella antibiotica]